MRFFIDSPLSVGAIVSLIDDELGHFRVMRPQINETLELVNGKGDLATATLISLGKKEATLQINTLLHEKEPFQYIIAQGIPKGPRLDTILEKGCELGMTELWLFPAEKSEKTSFSQERARKILIAAMKQSKRLHLPQIRSLPPIEKWSPFPFNAYFGSLASHAPSFLSTLQRTSPKKGVIFVVGPESGLSPKEEAHLLQLGAHGVSLHKNVLRTDTAPLAALTLMTNVKHAT